MHAAKARHCEVMLPHDVVVAAKLEAGAPSRVVPALETPADQMILDVGPKTVAHYTDVIGALQDAAVERPARRLRDRAVRRGHVRAGARRRRP